MSSTPSIRISQHQRQSSPPSYSGVQPETASPMPIPKVQDPVPPPLPPPTHIPEISTGQDPGWQWGNDPSSVDFGRSAAVNPGSSLLGGELRSPLHAKELEHTRNSSMDDGRRGSSLSTIAAVQRDHEMPDAQQPQSDEEGASRSRSGSNYRLQSERRLEQTTLVGSSNAYDKQLLSRIGGPSTPDSKRQSVSSVTFGPGMQETAQLAHAESERRNSQLRPLTVPSHERRQNSISDSPANSRFAPSLPSSGAISPGFAGFWEHAPADSNLLHTRNGSLSSSHRGSYDHTMYTHDDMEDSRMSSLNIHDRSPSGYPDDYANGAKAGTKRRASSPPRDLYYDERSSISSASGQSDAYNRRSLHQLPDRGSPVARFQPSHSSLSSASSYAPRHGSFGSSLGVPSVPSSATSYASGRVSPSALSPAIDPDLARARTPSGSGQSLKPSPILPNPQHGRTLSSSTQGGAQSSGPESAPHSRQSSLSQLHGMYICECCPKKPKKFDTEDDLRLHESEKQYSCAYCPNRFKNKNEAERHQNSLHLRRHSWSCAALAGPEAAFHQSMTGNGADVCGYCGEEFANPPRWELRAEHLNHVHKFGECNKAKKFFRADHFRQHLKHSHAGTSGKWTNMLENACMKDEPLPEKRAVTTNGGPPQAPPALMLTTAGLSGSPVQCSRLLERDPRDC